jgi:hypothetical protein
MLQVPEVVREKARALGADDWLEALPELVAEVAGGWSLSVTKTFDGGTEALVAAVTLDDCTPAVLKLPIPVMPTTMRRRSSGWPAARDALGCCATTSPEAPCSSSASGR